MMDRFSAVNVQIFVALSSPDKSSAIVMKPLCVSPVSNSSKNEFVLRLTRKPNDLSGQFFFRFLNDFSRYLNDFSAIKD